MAVLQDILQALERVEVFHDDEALREALVPRPVDVVVRMVQDVLLQASDHLLETRAGVCDHNSAVLHVQNCISGHFAQLSVLDNPDRIIHLLSLFLDNGEVNRFLRQFSVEGLSCPRAVVLVKFEDFLLALVVPRDQLLLFFWLLFIGIITV